MEDEDFMDEDGSLYDDIERAIERVEEALDYAQYILADESAVAIVENLEVALEILQCAREKSEVSFELDFNITEEKYH